MRRSSNSFRSIFFFIGIGLSFNLFFSGTARSGKLVLSPRESVSWASSREDKHLVNHLGPTLGYSLTKLPFQEEGDLILINSSVIDFPINKTMVELHWERFLKQETVLGAKSENRGCEERKNHQFLCSRLATTGSGKFVAELHSWTGKLSLVTMRVSSRRSLDLAEATLRKLQLQIKSGSKDAL